MITNLFKQFESLEKLLRRDFLVLACGVSRTLDSYVKH